jgi:hypothetical protein
MGSMGNEEGRCGKVGGTMEDILGGDGNERPTEKEQDYKEREGLGMREWGRSPYMEMPKDHSCYNQFGNAQPERSMIISILEDVIPCAKIISRVRKVILQSQVQYLRGT